jgi:hypothetical protein
VKEAIGEIIRKIQISNGGSSIEVSRENAGTEKGTVPRFSGRAIAVQNGQPREGNIRKCLKIGEYVSFPQSLVTPRHS